MIQHDEVIKLPSGTEIDVASALGDLKRVSDALNTHGRYDGCLRGDVDGFLSDLERVGELIVLLAANIPG